MKIGLLQQDIVWGKSDENRSRVQDIISHAEECDLWVLPEMFTTGFYTMPEEVAETDQELRNYIAQLSRQCRCAIAGSAVVQEKGRYYNRFYFATPDGSITTYDKRHLFSYGGENRHFAPGNKRVIVEYLGIRFLLQICYDLRFPVFVRNRNDYDVILYVANWPDSRIEVWDTLLRARAIENQCFVIGVNRCGSDGQGLVYPGHSVAIDAYGRLLTSCPPHKESVAYATIDMAQLAKFRQKFPVLDDGDDFTIL